MPVDLTYADTLSAVETIAQNVGGAPTATNKVTHTAFNKSAALGALTTPPVSKCAFFVSTLSGGTLTIDLTALNGTNGGIIDGTGLKMQFLRIENLGANDMTIATAGSNPQTIGAGAIIKPGGVFRCAYNDQLVDIDATHKNLTLTGTGSQQANVSIIMG